MKIEGHRKQVLLFLTAVLLPVIVLVALTLRIVKQERELTQKRIADEHRRVAAEIGQDLASRLDKVVRQEASALMEQPQKLARRDYVNPVVVLIAKIDDARLVLPWETSPKAVESSPFKNDVEFRRILGQAENAEFALKNYSLAADRYLRAAAVAGSPVREGYARLQRARALMRMKKESESLSGYAEVLSLSPEVIDEYGIPLSLYAVTPLLEVGSRYGQAVERIGRQIRSGTWLSPAGVYLMKDLLEKISAGAPETSGASIRGSAEEHLRKVLGLIQIMEQALGLKEDFPRLGLEPLSRPNLGKDEPLWVSYGQKPWLVGLSPLLPEGENLLVAIDFLAFSSAIASDTDFSGNYSGDVKLMMGLSTDGASLGPAFQGLSVVFGPGAEEVYSKQWSLQRLFYFLALAVVLSVTLFGAYLLWRDVRREVLMAEMRSQFVSSVSHELKTPLTAIRMFAETLRLGRAKDTNTQMEYLDTIVNESERLTRLLNNVLDFSKIEQGKRTYHLSPASLPEIVRTAARAMEYPLKQQGFALDVRIDESLPHVRVDRDAIEQAVLNLLSNAMKYSGESRSIDLKAVREGDCAVIQVIDRGVGIDPKDQTHIFEKFYRVPTRENQSLPGTGLGLSLVAHIAKAHGGSVRVESAPGEGSTFSIILPLGGEP
jgi:signal transduction histidine kinase/tetratricopeptide (TPR) repeat protein